MKQILEYPRRTFVLWLFVACFALLPRQSFAPPPDELELETTRVEPLAYEYSSPTTTAEIEAYQRRLYEKIVERARARGIPLHRVRVHFHYFGDELPSWVEALRVELARRDIRVGQRGEIRRWDKDFDEIWPPKRAKISEEQQQSELLAEIRRGEAVENLPAMADAALSENIINSVFRFLRNKAGIPGLLAIVVPYADSHTGVGRAREQQVRAFQQAWFFMTLTGIASAVQVFSRFGNDPNANRLAAIAVAASWRFYFTYFKDAGNVRHQLSKFYNPYYGDVKTSFWWSFASQLSDSLVSSFTFQFVLHNRLGLSGDVITATLLTSIAGSFAKIPFVQFLGGRAETLKADTNKVFQSVDNLLIRYRNSVERGHLPRSDLMETHMTDIMTLLKEGCHQEALERLLKIVEAVDAVRDANETAKANFLTELAEVRTILEGTISLSNRLFRINAAIDFAFDLLKYGSLMGIASINYTYGALALAGMSFLYAKHLLGRSSVKGMRDIWDMYRYHRIRVDSVENGERLARAIENRRALAKAMKWSFDSITEFTGLKKLLGKDRVSRWGDWLFRFREGKPAKTVTAALARLRELGLEAPGRLVLLERAFERRRAGGDEEHHAEEAANTHAEATKHTTKRAMTKPGTLQVWVSHGEVSGACLDLLHAVSHVGR